MVFMLSKQVIQQSISISNYQLAEFQNHIHFKPSDQVVKQCEPIEDQNG